MEDVTSCAFLEWTASNSNGLLISGTDRNILSFTFDDTFWKRQIHSFYYDILFINDKGECFTFVKGQIFIQFTVTQK